MSQTIEYLYVSYILYASSVTLRCVVLYKDFKCQNHTVFMSFFCRL